MIGGEDLVPPRIGAALLPWRLGGAPGARFSHDVGAVFRQLVSAGFDAVDLTDTFVPFGSLGGNDLEVVARELRRWSLSPMAVSVIRRSVIHPDEDRARQNREYTEAALQAAARLGAPVVSIGLHCELSPRQVSAEWFWTEPGHRDPDDPRQWERAVARIQSLAARANDLGLELSLEMYEDTYLGSAASALQLLDDIDRSNVGLNPDTGNLVRAHAPVEGWETLLKATLPRANYWHLKNYARSHDPSSGAYFTFPTSLELGVINYRRGIELAQQAGYRGAYCLEHYGGDGLGVCASNKRYLLTLLRDHRGVDQ